MSDARKVLMVYGGWDGHTPKESVDVFKPLLEEDGFSVELSDTLDDYLRPDLQDFDLIVQSWTNAPSPIVLATLKNVIADEKLEALGISREQADGLYEAVKSEGVFPPESMDKLLEAVESGVGYAGWHGGVIDTAQGCLHYHRMTGAQWTDHFGGCIPSYGVNVVDKEHPITKGIDSFMMEEIVSVNPGGETPGTEQYYCLTHSGTHVLCTTTFTGEHDVPGRPSLKDKTQPYAWTNKYGDGKVFVAAWGHTDKDFAVPQAKEIVRRGLIWAARE